MMRPLFFHFWFRGSSRAACCPCTPDARQGKGIPSLGGSDSNVCRCDVQLPPSSESLPADPDRPCFISVSKAIVSLFASTALRGLLCLAIGVTRCRKLQDWMPKAERPGHGVIGGRRPGDPEGRRRRGFAAPLWSSLCTWRDFWRRHGT
jgi:hypothetical protein